MGTFVSMNSKQAEAWQQVCWVQAAVDMRAECFDK